MFLHLFLPLILYLWMKFVEPPREAATVVLCTDVRSRPNQRVKPKVLGCFQETSDVQLALERYLALVPFVDVPWYDKLPKGILNSTPFWPTHFKI